MPPEPNAHVPAPKDSARLAELETIVHDGLRRWVEAGRALAEIRDRGLFRITHATFKAYIRQRWDLSSASAYQLIYTAQVVDAIEEGGLDVAPGVASNAMRQLVAVHHHDGPEAVCRVWREVEKRRGGRKRPPSAGDVRAVVVELGLRATADRGPQRVRLATVGELLQTLDGKVLSFTNDLRGKPLPPDAREDAAGHAQVARRIASALDVLADPGAAARELQRLERDELCVGHGRVRDERGVCVLCRRPDVANDARRRMVAGERTPSAA